MRMSRRHLCASSFYTYSSLILGSIAPALSCGLVDRGKEPDILSSLAFGSCNKQNMNTTHWPIITAKGAQGWLWMGDAIYADKLAPGPRADEYTKVISDRGYQALLKQGFVMGTWDDHDYASNDSGIEYPEKIASQRAFLNFIDEPVDSLRRSQEGIYWSKGIGQAAHQIQFILLDLRYFKQKDSVTNADPIGELQWAWLEAEIRKVGPSLKFLVSSIQVLTDFSGKDTWACYPAAQMRLLNLIGQSPVPLTILSGDRHLHEISRRQLTPDRLVHEVTSSGLTHLSDMKNLNAHRVDDQINETNFGVLAFDWNLKEKATIRGVRVSIYSPQSGLLLKDFVIPIRWT